MRSSLRVLPEVVGGKLVGVPEEVAVLYDVVLVVLGTEAGAPAEEITSDRAS